MYKLIFADDESLVRSKVSQMVQWESMGFTLVGCCANGYELMELVEKELPDLVILDINMPFINGLEAARQIRHSYPHIRLVFLTGYTEFEYAKRAIELNVMRYVVKPVDVQELTDVLREAKQALEQENERICKLTELEHGVQQNQKVLLDDLLESAVHSATLYARAQACGFCWSESTLFQIAVFGLDEAGREEGWRDAEEQTMLYGLCNVTQELAEQQRLGPACVRKDRVVLLGCASSAPQAQEKLTLAMQECVENVLRTASTQLHFTASAGLGTVGTGCEKIAQSLTEASQALTMRVTEGGNQMFTADDRQDCAGNYSAVCDAVSYIQSAYAHPELSADAVCAHLHMSPSYLRTIFKRQTGSTIIGYITRVRMERACALLKENELKNSQIAETVGYMDPHYFGYCFKRYFGVSPAEMRERFRVL